MHSRYSRVAAGWRCQGVAVGHYREMVALQPDFEMGHFNLGTTLQVRA